MNEINQEQEANAVNEVDGNQPKDGTIKTIEGKQCRYFGGKWLRLIPIREETKDNGDDIEAKIIIDGTTYKGFARRKIYTPKKETSKLPTRTGYYFYLEGGQGATGSGNVIHTGGIEEGN